MNSVTVNALLLLMVVVNAPGESGPPIATAARIRSYCREVSDFTHRQESEKRIFAEVWTGDSRAGHGNWKELADAIALEKVRASGDGVSAAFVWFKDDILSQANFTFQSESGDWVHYADYCFRPDGSLALLKSTLNTFYGEMSVERETLFSANGTTLDSATRYLDLRTGKPKRAASGFTDDRVPVYTNVFQLPFLIVSSTGSVIDQDMFPIIVTNVFDVPVILPERLKMYPPLPQPLPPINLKK